MTVLASWMWPRSGRRAILPGMPPAVPAPPDRAARHRCWFPLLLFGGLAALSPPLSALASPRPAAGVALLTREIYPTVTQAMYFGGGSASGPFPFPLGWYWVGVLLSGLLITTAWYRWQDRRTGRGTPARGYLVTGLVLAAVTAALPLLAWGTPVSAAGPGLNAWSWLDSFWRPACGSGAGEFAARAPSYQCRANLTPKRWS
jgi:hypothetical protein